MLVINEKGKSGFSKWASLIVVVVGTFMAILDSSIVNVALPKLMSVFGSTVEQARWIITAYSLTMGSVIPLTGYLCNKYGTKRIYIFSLIMFTVGSLLCGFAWSNQSMIAFRIIQGLGGGLIMPVSMSILYDIVEPSELGMAMGLWGIAAMAAPAIGPTLSGYIIQYLDWRLIFTINIPIGFIGVVLSMILLKKKPAHPAKGFDYTGFISSTVGLICCLYVLGEGNVDFKDVNNVLLLTFGGFCLLLFVINELTHPQPLLNLRLLKIPDFMLSIIISSVLTMAMFGFVFIFPLYLQSLRGYSAMQTGMIMFPSAIITGFVMPISGMLTDKFGAKPLMFPGLLLLAYSTYELSSINLNTSIDWIIAYSMLRGVALGLTMMPVTTNGMKFVPPAQVAGASALSNTIRQVSAAISITALTSLMQKQQDIGYYKHVEYVNQFQPTVTDWISKLQAQISTYGMNTAESSALLQSTLFGLVQKNVVTVSIQATLLFTMIFAVLAIPLVALTKEPPKSKKDTNSSIIID